MTDRNSVVIIGAGHNGLTCAAYLARAGKKVVVLEAAGLVGGLAVTRGFAPGFRVSSGAHLLNMLDPKISRELKLDSHGLKMAKSGISTVALAENGAHLVISGSEVSGRSVSARDREAMVEYHRFMTRFAGIIGALHNRIPPRIRTTGSDMLGLARTAWDIRRLGTADMREFLRITGINIYDILQENFEHPGIRGALSLDGVLGSFLGPRSNNSVFCALHRLSGNAGMNQPRGGMGAVSEAIAAAARQHGVEIRTGCRVSGIGLEDGRVNGVELDDGEKIAAGTVISNADPKTTFFDLLGARHIEAGLVRKLRHVRNRGNASKLHLALDGIPGFRGLDHERTGQRLVIAPDIEYVERAFNHAKYGEYSAEPVMEITIPSLHDDSLAPAGKHVLSAVVQYTPYELKAGWAGAKQAFTEKCIELIARYAPSIKEQVLHAELLTPEDIETQFLVGGGHWHHAELALDQFLMMRPVPGIAQYQTPVGGLYLCGAGSHPGGGVMGSAGRNAARAVLAGG
jgi:phytoene dehydrogenase-like protein